MSEGAVAAHTVLVIDDQAIVRLGLEVLVLSSPGLRLVGSAASLAQGLELIARHEPELVITEMMLGDATGLQTVQAVLAAQGARRTLVLSTQDETVYGEQVLAMGAGGYLMKEAVQTDLLPAAAAVLAGERWLSPRLTARLVDRLLRRPRSQGDPGALPLTTRELQVLDHLKAGASTKQIAAALGVSARTIDLYRSSMKKKLGLRSSAELIAFASSQQRRGGRDT